MFMKPIIPVLLAFACAQSIAARPQHTTVLPFFIDDSTDDPNPQSEDVLSGIIVGTGANGETTYVISMVETRLNDTPATATYIVGASGGTAIVAYTDFDTSVATQSIACGFEDGNADCTVVVVAAFDSSITTTIVEESTGPAGSIALVVSTSSVSEAEATGSGSASAPSSTESSASGSTDSSGAWKHSAFGVFASMLVVLAAAAAMA